MSNLIKHAERELALLSNEPDEMQTAMNDHILKMVKVFSEEGHSGFSANYAISIIQKLLRFEPLKPLTGEDSEWNDVGNNTLQNNRCGHVFKDTKTGIAYDIEGKIFQEPDGSRWTSSKSKVDVTFPYTPKSEIVKVESIDNL